MRFWHLYHLAYDLVRYQQKLVVKETPHRCARCVFLYSQTLSVVSGIRTRTCCNSIDDNRPAMRTAPAKLV